MGGVVESKAPTSQNLGASLGSADKMPGVAVEVQSGFDTTTSSSSGDSSSPDQLSKFEEPIAPPESAPPLPSTKASAPVDGLQVQTHCEGNSSISIGNGPEQQSPQPKSPLVDIQSASSTAPPSPEPQSRTMQEAECRNSLVFKTQRESIQSKYGTTPTSAVGKSTPETLKSKVSFAGVTVLYHEIRVGDHLDCDGPPLALGKFRDSAAFAHVDDYERERPYLPRLDPHMGAFQRFEILQREGFSFTRIMTILQEMEEEERNRQRGKLRLLMCVFGKR